MTATDVSEIPEENETSVWNKALRTVPGKHANRNTSPNYGLQQANAVSCHMKHYPLNYTGRAAKGSVSAATKAVGSPRCSRLPDGACT
jgi:hypothetical protein